MVSYKNYCSTLRQRNGALFDGNVCVFAVAINAQGQELRALSRDLVDAFRMVTQTATYPVCILIMYL